MVQLLGQSTPQQVISVPPSTSTGTQTQSITAPAGYSYIGAESSLSGRSSAYFTHPTYGTAILVSFNGNWKAFSATCTHLPCTVQYSPSTIVCPCHHGTFSPNNGAVLGGPPPSPLPEFGVLISGGNVFVSDARVN